MITKIDKLQELRRYLVYDLEWVPGTLEVRLVGVYDGERYRAYRSVKDFLRHELTDKNRGAWFYAHFGGGADVQFILPEVLSDPEYSATGSFSGSALIMAHLKKGHNVWHFLDSYWLIRQPLSKIGEWLGLAKTGPDKSKEDARKWYAEVPEKELIEYNERDCVILWRAIREVELAVLAKGGMLQMTLASTAMFLFRRKYLKQEIQTSDTINDVARLAYIASRVEVFTKRCEEAYYYDVNSSFPFGMTFPQPGRFLKFHNSVPGRVYYDEHPSLIRARIRVPEEYITPLPLRVDTRIVFPSGEWEGWLTSVDASLIQESGGEIVRAYEAIEFEPFFDLRDYAVDLYNSRMAASSEAEKQVYKLLLNTLYGKWAEMREKLRLHLNPSEKVLQHLSRDCLCMPGLWCEPTIAPVPHMHVPISAHITAIARRTLYQYLVKSSEVYYCDTDGFATLDPYDISPQLGGLKLEKIISAGQFLAPKVYGLHTDKGDIYKAKGFSLGEGKVAKKRFARLAAGMDVTIDRMIRIRENLKHGQIVPREVLIAKKLNPEALAKRHYYPDGQSRPFHTSELGKKR